MLSPDGQRSLGLLLIHLAPEVAEAAAKAKVGDLGVLVVVNEDVPGGEVAMDDLEKKRNLDIKKTLMIMD